VNASIAAAPGSGFQATYGDTLWFSLDANMSISGSPHLSLSSSKMVGSRDHSVLLLCDYLLALSASVFNFPGMWEIDSASCLCTHQMRISLVISLQFLDLEPPILRIYETAVVLSQSTLMVQFVR